MQIQSWGNMKVKQPKKQVWQKFWGAIDAGRRLYNIQFYVDLRRKVSRNRKEEI